MMTKPLTAREMLNHQLRLLQHGLDPDGCLADDPYHYEPLLTHD